MYVIRRNEEIVRYYVNHITCPLRPGRKTTPAVAFPQPFEMFACHSLRETAALFEGEEINQTNFCSILKHAEKWHFFLT